MLFSNPKKHGFLILNGKTQLDSLVEKDEFLSECGGCLFFAILRSSTNAIPVMTLMLLKFTIYNRCASMSAMQFSEYEVQLFAQNDLSRLSKEND
jgi:hypothetical protein